MKKPEDFQSHSRLCSKWADIIEWLDDFPSPEMSVDHEDNTLAAKAWVYRGLKSSSYELQPVIERAAQSTSLDWAALEGLVLAEFKARARMHLSAPLIPADEFTWLAQMQHYAIPTRLLDFTYSPFVALYFAIRNSQECPDRNGQNGPGTAYVRLWALNADEVNRRFKQVAFAATTEEAKEAGELKFQRGSAMEFAEFNSLSTARDSVTAETQGFQRLVAEALGASGTRREVMNQRGCICAASPPAFNPRLASQQGVFLLNFALDLSFNDSLQKMMEGCSGWLKTIDIPACLIPDIERWLFQMNVHEQSLFPDMEGLAGLIRQKLRLHWAPNQTPSADG